jgi:hypothetical protein
MHLRAQHKVGGVVDEESVAAIFRDDAGDGMVFGLRLGVDMKWGRGRGYERGQQSGSYFHRLALLDFLFGNTIQGARRQDADGGNPAARTLLDGSKIGAKV